MIKRIRIIETPRMFMREMNTDDALSFFQLNEDEEVMKYTGDKRFESENASYDFLSKYPAYTYESCGFGRWTCISKNDNKVLGWSGIRKQDDGMIDLGYRLHQEFWNQGFGTESAIASLKVAFEIYHLPWIYARANQQNTASIRVMQKVGMNHWKSDSQDHFYRIFRNEFFASEEVSISLQ
ncbi:MAG: GNAT family N-acetyltransferase [Bacteroidia bacterium]